MVKTAKQENTAQNRQRRQVSANKKNIRLPKTEQHLSAVLSENRPQAGGSTASLAANADAVQHTECPADGEKAANTENAVVLNAHSKEVRSMFKAITRRYDLLNHVCSLGIDFWWRKQLVSGFVLGKTNAVLDMAAGTLDVSAAALKRFPQVRVVAGDICPEMLEYGIKKIKEEDKHRIEVKCINALSVPYAENSFDVVSIAFGIRNVDDREAALSQMHKVLVNGGQLHILEFSPVKNPLLQKCYYFYLEKVMPAVAKLFGENADAYRYLARTIRNFPSQEEFCAEIKNAGFAFVNYKKLTLGIVTVYTAIKTK